MHKSLKQNIYDDRLNELSEDSKQKHIKFVIDPIDPINSAPLKI